MSGPVAVSFSSVLPSGQPAGLTLPAILVALAVIGWRAMAVLPRGSRPVSSRGAPPGRFLRDGQRATAMLDFVLTFPFFLMIVLTVVQMALVINARLMVGWAAYAAARAAVVNTDGGEDVAKARAERAAAIATLPISPSIRALEYPDPSVWLLLAAGEENPRLPGTQLQRRWTRSRGKLAWARRATDVRIEGAQDDGTFAAKAPVTVTVTHRYDLAVPWAGRIFAAFRGGWWLGRPVTPLVATVTLANQGRIETDGPLGTPCKTPVGSILGLLKRIF